MLLLGLNNDGGLNHKGHRQRQGSESVRLQAILHKQADCGGLSEALLPTNGATGCAMQGKRGWKKKEKEGCTDAHNN